MSKKITFQVLDVKTYVSRIYLENQDRMKKVMLLILLIFISCSNKYDLVLDGLSKNYILLNEEIEKDLFYKCFKLTDKEYLNDSIEYKKAVKDFFNLDKGVLKYLLSYENDTINKACKWIITKNPYSSIIKREHLFNNSEGAMILLDNYLKNSSIINIPEYVNELSYKKIKLFYFKNKNLTKGELRDEYIKTIDKQYVGNGLE